MPKHNLNNDLLNALVGEDEDHSKEIELRIALKEYDKAEFLTAKEIIQKYHIITPTDTYEPIYYAQGIYAGDTDRVIHEEIVRLWGTNSNNHREAEIKGHIKRLTGISRDKINNGKEIPCLNGLLDVEKKELLPFSPKKIYTFQIPVEYNKNAVCPIINQFIHSTFGEEQEILGYELIGYCLTPGYPIQKAFMLTGNGSNGKSTYLNLLKTFLGTENTAHIGLLALCEGEYSVGWLYGKLSNIYADLEDKAIRNTGTIKMLTGGDRITANRKHVDPISFINSAKMVFSANKIPIVYDDADAFFRRWIIVKFDNIFSDKEADKKLIEKLTTSEELSGLLNVALNSLENLLKKGCFSYNKTTDEIRNEYSRLSDPISAFVQDCLVCGDTESLDYQLFKEDVYKNYCEYCSVCNLQKKNEVWFWKGLKQRIDYITMRVDTQNGLKQRVHGFRLNNYVLEHKCVDNKQEKDVEVLKTGYSLGLNDDIAVLGGQKQGKQGKQGIFPLRETIHHIDAAIGEIPCLPCFTLFEGSKTAISGVEGLEYPVLVDSVRELHNYMQNHSEKDKGILFDDLVVTCGGDENRTNQYISELKTKGLIYEPKKNIFMVNI